jgi:Activator of Hsp90 ATPase homolog 1-like protein
MTDAVQREGTITLRSDRELLCSAYSTRRHAPFCDIDLRVGGAWRWVVTKPQGMEIEFSGVYREIDAPRRAGAHRTLLSHAGSRMYGYTELRRKDGQTTLTMSMLFENKEQRDGCLHSGMEVGVREC